MKNIVLASGSPRRVELMKLLGFNDIAVIPPQIDEQIPDGKDPEEIVCGLALQKAEAVASLLAPDLPLIIAADTLVFLDGCALGKPAGDDDAADMLRKLSGRVHSVYTGIAMLSSNKRLVCPERTDVYFRQLSESEITGYVATGEPMDKAGAYAAQGYAAAFIERIEGDFFNVMGLPLCRLSVMLKAT